MSRELRQARIFAEPTRSTIVWDDIERLLIAIGCEVG